MIRAKEMKMDLHETRRKNLLLLAQSLGSLAEINVHIGKDRKAPYLYAIICRQKRNDGTFQVAGEKLCSKIEHALGLPVGWMSQEHDEGSVPPLNFTQSMRQSLNVQPPDVRTPPALEGGG